MNLRVFKNIEEFSQGTSEFIAERLRDISVSGKEDISVVLAGGNTPVPVYEKLASSLLEELVDVIERIRWFFGDERWVEVSHSDSNEGMARRTLLNRLKVSQESIFSWRVDRFKDLDFEDSSNAPVECALEYEKRLEEFFIARGERPDIVILGMGDDGHTASLFPDGEFVLKERSSGKILRDAMNPDIDRLAVAVYRKHFDMWRLTLTPKFFNMARLVVFLIDGAKKRGIFRRILETGGREGRDIPATWISGEETLYFVTSSVYS